MRSLSFIAKITISKNSMVRLHAEERRNSNKITLFWCHHKPNFCREKLVNSFWSL